MPSPRSSWTGTIQLGLLNVPITLGNATQQEREQSIKQVCSCHTEPVDRRERCAVTGEHGPDKQMAVALPDGSFQVISETQWAALEDANNSKMLQIEEVVPVSKLPLEFSMGTYYVRAKSQDEAAAHAYKLLVESIHGIEARIGEKVGLTPLWNSRSSTHLVAITLDSEGKGLLLSKIPMADQLREKGDQERAHESAEVNPKMVELGTQLLESFLDREWDHKSKANAMLEAKRQVVDDVINNREAPAVEKKPAPSIDNLMATLEASVAANKGS